MTSLRLGATLVLLGTFTLGVAETTVDEQIIAINTATTAQERVKLMNEFKQNIADMGEQERGKAITQLRSSMNSDEDQLQAQTRTRNSVNQVEQAENMQQQQAASQAKQQNQLGTAGQNSNKFRGNK